MRIPGYDPRRLGVISDKQLAVALARKTTGTTFKEASAEIKEGKRPLSREDLQSTITGELPESEETLQAVQDELLALFFSDAISPHRTRIITDFHAAKAAFLGVDSPLVEVRESRPIELQYNGDYVDHRTRDVVVPRGELGALGDASHMFIVNGRAWLHPLAVEIGHVIPGEGLEPSNDKVNLFIPGEVKGKPGMAKIPINLPPEDATQLMRRIVGVQLGDNVINLEGFVPNNSNLEIKSDDGKRIYRIGKEAQTLEILIRELPRFSIGFKERPNFIEIEGTKNGNPVLLRLGLEYKKPRSQPPSPQRKRMNP